MQYLSFCVWFISFVIITPSCMHVVTNGRISLLSWIVFHHIYHTIYLFLCRWIIRLTLYLWLLWVALK
jgi:hypothetical protein